MGKGLLFIRSARRGKSDALQQRGLGSTVVTRRVEIIPGQVWVLGVGTALDSR